MFKSNGEALEVLSNPREKELRREEAAAYLERHAEPGTERAVIEGLVRALRDDDLGVRWAAAEGLARLGREGLPALLAALMDPDLAGDIRVRDAAHHVLLHMAQRESAPAEVRALLDALEGPAADLATMEEAAHWLQVMRSRR